MMDKEYECAKHLVGKTLNGEWKVIEKLNKEDGETGGYFSVGYVVESRQRGKAFLKAIDFSNIFKNPTGHLMERLKDLTNAYDFEVKLLEKCVKSNLRYVVKMIDKGEYTETGFLYPVPYMIFELAETSARKCLDYSRLFDFAWSLRSLHNVAVAINELHMVEIAHQDIKPSNVMLFEEKTVSKIGDVGRSSLLGEKISHDEFAVAGDRTYSPIEQLYGWIDPDWKIRRYSCDMYMFGNLIYTYFNGVSLNTALFKRMKKEYVPTCFGGSYSGSYQDILQAMVYVFDQTVDGFDANMNADLREELINLIRQLCHPDYKRRGDLTRNGAPQYSMEKYISKLDLLCRRYEYELKKGLNK